MNRNRFVVGGLGLALLFGPWLAAVAGARSDPVASENRALASRPEWRGFATLDEITAFAADRFPLRDNAISANKRLGNAAGSGEVKGSAITTQTIKGNVEPWLFLSEDLTRACEPEIDIDDAIAGLKRLNEIITRSGRRFVFTIIPDKSTFETQFLPSSYPLQSCGVGAKAERLRRLAALKLPGYLDIAPTLRADEKATGKPAYQARNTHWTDRSGALFVKAMAEKIDPRVAGHSEVRFSYVTQRPDDLSILVGDSSPHDAEVWDIARPGVVPNVVRKAYAPDGYEMRTITATTTGPATLIADKTFWIGDSFSDHAVHQYSTYFADLVEMPDLTKASSVGQTTDGKNLTDTVLPVFLQGIKDSKIVVLEAVERFFFGRADGSLLHKDFLDKLEATLR